MEKYAKDDLIIGKTCKRKIPLIIREDDISYNLYSKQKIAFDLTFVNILKKRVDLFG